MLRIGRIERFEEDPEQPLRTIIYVRPMFEDLRRIPDVVFRIPDFEDTEIGGRP